MDMSRKRVIATIAVVAIVIVLAAGAAIAPEGTASNGHGNQLAGAWMLTVQVAGGPPFAAQQVYTDDGSFLSFGVEPPAGRSPEMGSWERVEGRLYASSGSFFRFNPQTGALIGSARINRTLRLSDDGQSLTVIGRVQVLDLGGNVITSFLAQGTGERMPVERIAEQP
jgi:hypothetical protein